MIKDQHLLKYNILNKMKYNVLFMKCKLRFVIYFLCKQMLIFCLSYIHVYQYEQIKYNEPWQKITICLFI